MANISKIKTPDGTTYELAPKEENIKWGGDNVVGSVSPIGMSLSADHSANRIAFINGDLLSVEGSTDNGNTWTDYGLTKGEKTSFCTSDKNIHIGTNSVEACTLNSKLRITLTAQNGTNPSNRVYTNPKKLLVNVSTANGLEVLIEVRTGTNYLNNGAWDKFGTYTVSGWSGWNDIPLILDGRLGGGINQPGNYWQLRLTFSVTSLHSGEQWRSNCYVTAIRIYGDNPWITPSNMARHNHIYDYDYNQNTTFPANVTAPKFIGALQGNADTATSATSATTASKLGSSNVGSATQPIYLNGGTPTATTYTLGKSVPSDAVFTDNNTTYTFAEGTTDGAFKVTPSGGTAQSVPVHGVLTSHQSVIDNNPTLSWGSKSKVATIGSTEINVTMPSNPASGKQDTITGAATTVTSSNLTASRVLISNTAGKISAASGVTTTEVGYLAGLDRSVSGFYSHKSYDTSINVDDMRGISGQFEYNGSYWMKRTEWADMPGNNSYGYLEVMGNFQRFTNYSSSGSGVAYLRMYANSEWSPWTQIKDTTYESKTASSGGTAVSLCTTGEKYTWNSKVSASVSGTVLTLS